MFWKCLRVYKRSIASIVGSFCIVEQLCLQFKDRTLRWSDVCWLKFGENGACSELVEEHEFMQCGEIYIDPLLFGEPGCEGIDRTG